jgi:hypothetical protein
MLGKDFNPYPKHQQLKSHQKEKDTPKIVEKRPRKRKTRTVRGRTIPTAKVRSNISKKDYNKAIETFGEACAICKNPYIEMHHIRFRSQQGRGGFRNLLPLCKEHHMKAHKERSFADKLKEERESIYGKWYWADKFDLFQENLIPNTTDKAFEKFMVEEGERIAEKSNDV